MIAGQVECPSCCECMEVSIEDEDWGDVLEHNRTCDKCGYFFKLYINYEVVFISALNE